MDEIKPQITLKKTYFYKFIPSKAEEEACKVNDSPWEVTRELIQIRDIYPAPKIDLKNPWQIKIKITNEDCDRDQLVIPFFKAFEYVFRYWKLSDVKNLEDGIAQKVGLWDVTEENNPKFWRYRFKKLRNDNYGIMCLRLYRGDRGLGSGDIIGLYWDPRSSNFMFKLLYKVCRLKDLQDFIGLALQRKQP